MTPTTNAKNIRNRKPRHRKRNRRGRARDKVRSTDSPQPLDEVLNERKRKPKKKSSIPIPVSDDPLEKNIPEKTPMPQGYVLVPKGDVYVTRHCRSKTKDADQIVYVVYVSSPTLQVNLNLTHQNHTGKRTLGIRVPEDIHISVLASAAETKESRANAVSLRDKKDLSKSRALLKSEFPLMPKESLKIILEHAFLKGSGRVGRTGMISDDKKILLAVDAHIRHVHTPYEKLLDAGVGRKEAREQVWDSVKAVERAWQGVTEEKQLPLRPA
ncbi:hypothetical protein N7452_003818 [Penicillium brevicompactum]|uniref:DUF2293 domain-containing protein n=1 Tax=Penicillium brevicompactum TaxID=5074 RepID=A0A9W9QUK5_PENBR|nr:hypothetical protein N7452_003818 [Penicillium brevicompactum]